MEEALLQEIQTILADAQNVSDESLSTEQRITIRRLGRLILDAAPNTHELALLSADEKTALKPIGWLICRWWTTLNTYLNSMQVQRLRSISRHILGPGEDPLGGKVDL